MESQNVNSINISQFYQMKKKRYEKQLEKKNNLEKQIELLKKSGFKKLIKTFFYYLKRVVITIFAMLLISSASFLLFAPKILTAEEDFQESFMEDLKEKYLKEVASNLAEAFIEGMQDGFTHDEAGILNALDLVLERKIIKDLKVAFNWLGFLLILFALALISSMRLNGKLRKSDLKLNEVELFSRSTIIDFVAEIEEEAKELKLLEEIIKES